MPHHWTLPETSTLGTRLGNWPVFILDLTLKMLT